MTTTTTTKVPVTCPPSSVHDMITEWTDSDGNLNVYPGDLIVHEGKFTTIEAITLGAYLGRPHARVRLTGRRAPIVVRTHELVAVRRYDTGEDR